MPPFTSWKFGLALSEADVRAGRYDDALGATSELLAKRRDLATPDHPRTGLSRKGDVEGAARDFQDAVRGEPKSALARFYLARA